MAAWTPIYTFIAGQVPTASNWNANPSSLSTLLSGALDAANVDTSSSDGIGVLNGNQTWTGTMTRTGTSQFSNTLTVGVNDTGYDVKFFGAAAGAFSLWDESANKQILQGATAAGPGALTLATGELTVVNTNRLGQIDFVAPLESSGTDAIVAGASIWAEATDTFAADNNTTDLVFAAATSEAAAARMRMKKGSLVPQTTDTMSLGTSALNWSDLFLDSGGVINFDGGNVTVTHSTGTLTVAGNVAATDLDGIIGSNTAAAGTFTTVTVGGLDLGTTGNRIDLDTDNDTSIRASADDIITFEAAGVDHWVMDGAISAGYATFKTIATQTNTIAAIEIKQPASSTESTILRFIEGDGSGDANNMAHDFGYRAADAYFHFNSQDGDGSSGALDVWRCPDGQVSMDCNTTWDDNAFDYACDDCGWHGPFEVSECPDCGGKVGWHDDAALIHTALHSPAKNNVALAKLEQMGVMNTYGTIGNDKPEVFTSIQNAHMFTFSAIGQLHKRLEELERKVA